MTIQLGSDDERMIAKRLESGAFSSVEEVIHRALEAQDTGEAWLASERIEIEARIERGLAQAERGEVLSAEELRTRMTNGKAAWTSEHAR